jgi:predicted O-linked N-acetylglucosamine transferase (SPINDLY family)
MSKHSRIFAYIIGGHAPSSHPDIVSASALHKLKQAQERLQHGDVAGARFLCKQVLERAPRNPDALCLLGVLHLMSGQPDAAVPLFRQTLSSEPHHGIALEHLGLAHLLLGQFQDAERELRKAAALPGAPASVFMRLGASLLHQQKPAESAQALRHALELAPEDVDSHLNLGQALARMGDTASARRHFEAVLRLVPTHADAMFNLGVLHLNHDELDEARQWFERIISQTPQYGDAHVNLGIVFQRQLRFDDALTCFRRALELNPALASAGNNLAHTLALQGRFEEAREKYLATLRLAPGFMEAHEGLASTCLALGRLKEGIVHLRETVRLDPESHGAWTALADALFQDGRLEEAESAGEHAIALDPNAAAPYSIRAQIHVVRGELDRAVAVLEAGFQRTRADSLLGMLTHHLHRLCDWEKWRDAWREMARRLDASAELGSPFWLLNESSTAEQQLAYTRRWAASQFRNFHPTPGASGRSPRPARPRLRIGYLSSDFHEHAAAYLLAEVLELHDRERFEIFAYSYGPEDHSPMRARLRQACEHFVDIAWDPDDIATRRIAEDALDVLVDLKGYTLGARTSLLARRPCPIQVNWLGYPGTMGAPFIDYLIADEFVVPEGKETAYAERVLRLPHCYQPNDRKRPLIEPRARGEYGLPEDGFVFCCFNQTVKITPEIFACWMRLLGRVPNSVLWLVEDNRWATRNLKDAARSHGISPERLAFTPRMPFAQHLARYCVADLALDTFPYTSHTTASDALWLGCPLVALCGETFAARVSGSILTACGMPELIAYSLEDYETLAYRLASDRALMDRIRVQLVSSRQSAPLFDSAAFARDLEQIYIKLVDWRQTE